MPQLYGAALVIAKSPVIAEDISQEVFTRFWENREKAPGIRNLRAFLFIAARNMLLNRLAHIEVEAAYHNYLRNKDAASSLMPDEQLAYHELEKKLHKAIVGLPARQQEVFRLSREQGMTYEEIAEQLNISRETVKEHIIKALATLRKALHAYDPLLVTIILDFAFGRH